MPETPNPEFSLTIYLAVGGLLSSVTLLVLFQRHVSGQPLLAYRPRVRVPWGPAATLVAIFLLIVQVVPELFAAGADEDQLLDPSSFISSSLFGAAAMIGMTVLGMFWLMQVAGATWRDLGLPANAGELVHDACLGVVTCLAALLPVYLLLLTLNFFVEPQQIHPLIEQLLEHRSPGMMAAGFLVAVVAAPLFEEFAFRLLLQGWLERWEDEQLGYDATERRSVASQTAEDSSAQEAIQEDELAVEHGELSEPPSLAQTADNPFASPLVNVRSEETASCDLPEQPIEKPERGVLASLPHGWLPILLSGLVFGLAHFGHGIDPVPLVLFGVVLGYVYQRTHRLLPCIVAHLLFNAFSLGQLWFLVG